MLGSPFCEYRISEENTLLYTQHLQHTSEDSQSHQYVIKMPIFFDLVILLELSHRKVTSQRGKE